MHILKSARHPKASLTYKQSQEALASSPLWCSLLLSLSPSCSSFNGFVLDFCGALWLSDTTTRSLKIKSRFRYSQSLGIIRKPHSDEKLSTDGHTYILGMVLRTQRRRFCLNIGRDTTPDTWCKIYFLFCFHKISLWPNMSTFSLSHSETKVNVDASLQFRTIIDSEYILYNAPT